MGPRIFDVIVIGAGLSGIAAVRFYLDIHPNSQVLVLEKDKSIGGPWGKSRMYPGFWSQSGIRMSGFSDVPLTVPDDAEVFNDLFEAKYVTDYLERYVDDHVYAGKSLRGRIILCFTLEAVEKQDDMWTVHGTQDPGGVRESFKTKRLIVATGTTSDAKMPALSGSSDFEGTILHQKDYGRFTAQQPSQRQNIVVLGAGKSAADIVYNQVKAGNEVHWIIRKSGEGPGAFTNPADNSNGLFLNDPELAATRLFATLSPGCFTEPGMWTRFLHNTALGNKLLSGVWSSADQKCKTIGNFKGREGALEGFEKLESEVKLFWCTGPFGMIQRPDFWDTVARNVHVHRNDIERLSQRTMVLQDGPSLDIDVIICATGFRNEYPFFSTEQRIELGLPHARVVNADEKLWVELEAEADEQVLGKYPVLEHPPPTAPSQIQSEKTPNRLYNTVIPLHDHTIAFVGNLYVPNAFRVAEVQAIYTTALFDNVLKLPTKYEMRKDIAWVNAFNKRRYPTHGALANYFHYDMMGYIDRLLGEVGEGGLNMHRKGWWRDWVMPIVAADLAGLKEEYVGRFGEKYMD